METTYIPHGMILRIVPDSLLGVVIITSDTTKENYYTTEEFTTSANGITGRFTPVK